MSAIKRAYSDIEEMFLKGDLSLDQIANVLDLSVEFVEDVVDGILFEELETV